MRSTTLRSGLGRWAIGALGALASLLTFAAGDAARAQSIIRDAEIEDTLRVYADPIFTAANLNAADVEITLLQDPSLNAFVTNGQRMFLHTGLILAAESPNQLKGVMAHETGHIAGAHLARMREAAQQAMAPAFISIGLGILAIAAGAPDAGAALIGGSQQFAMASFVRHTQVQESAADQAAVTYMDATGQSPLGLLEFFDKFRYQEVMSEARRNPYFRTHPLSSDRMQALRERIDASPHRDAVESADHQERFRMMQAKLFGFIETPARTYNRYPAKDVSLEARYARAVAAYRIPDTALAVREAESLIADRPNNPYFHELLGQILFESGKAAESVAHHRRAVDLRPDNPLLQVNLARAILAAQGKAGAREAITLLQAAVARERDNAFAWRELASAHDLLGEDGLARLASAEQWFVLGDFPRALNFAQRARKALPEGEAAWRRASDIVLISESAVKTRRRT